MVADVSMVVGLIMWVRVWLWKGMRAHEFDIYVNIYMCIVYVCFAFTIVD